MATAEDFRAAVRELEEQCGSLAHIRGEIRAAQNDVPIEGCDLKTRVQHRYDEIIEMGYHAERGLESTIDWLLDMVQACMVYTEQMREYLVSKDTWPSTANPDGSPLANVDGDWILVPQPEPPEPPYPWIEASPWSMPA